jgi:hypothetical protein
VLNVLLCGMFLVVLNVRSKKIGKGKEQRIFNRKGSSCLYTITGIFPISWLNTNSPQAMIVAGTCFKQ